MKKLSLSSSNGSYIIYVNGQLANDHTALGRLVHDFSCLYSKDIYDETLKECVKRYKETEEGINTMCTVMEELRNEGKKQGLDQGIALMAKLYSLGRNEDAKRVQTDPKYRAQLMKELAIQQLSP